MRSLFVLALILLGCDLPDNDNNTSAGDEVSTTSTSSPSNEPMTSSGSGEDDTTTSTGDEGSGDGGGSGSGGGGEPACQPVVDLVGTVIGQVCQGRDCRLGVEPLTGICIQRCGEVCPSGQTCEELVIDQELVSVCWPSEA
jgi:hypothetical protein